jgi:hypothetical protein
MDALFQIAGSSTTCCAAWTGSAPVYLFPTDDRNHYRALHAATERLKNKSAIPHEPSG